VRKLIGGMQESFDFDKFEKISEAIGKMLIKTRKNLFKEILIKQKKMMVKSLFERV
jgi:hypothetical protein